MDTSTVNLNPNKADAWKMDESPSKFNVPLGSDPNFGGPVAARQCTDSCWIAVFLLANLALGAFSAYSYWWGDPHRLVRGWDFRAELCGVGSLATKPYTFLINPNNSTTLSICLEGCPILASEHAVCLYDTDHTTDTPELECFNAYASKPYVNRYCLPADKEGREAVLNWLYQPMPVVTRTLGDLYRAWDVLALSGVVSVLVALFYLTWLKMGHCFLILGVLSLLALWLLLAGTVYLIYEESMKVADAIYDNFDIVVMQSTDRNLWSWPYKVLYYSAGLFFIAISIGTLISVFKLCRGTRFLSISVRPLRQATCLLLVPFCILILGAGVFALLLTLSFYAGSCATIGTTSADIVGGEVKEVSFHIVERCLIFYEILIVMWWFSLLAGVMEYLAGSFTAFWFFGKDKYALDQPFRRSLKNLLRYHFGSLLLASICIPALRLPKYILGALRSFSRFLGIDKTRFCSSCFGLCFDCYDSLLRYLDYQALAYQTLWGGSLCEGAKRGFYLMERYKIGCRRLIAAGDFYVWVFQLVVTMSAPVFVYFWVIHMEYTFKGDLTKHVSTATGLACVSLFMSWFTAQVLGGFIRGVMYGGVICYLCDSEMFVGEQRFADNELAAIFGEGEEAIKKLSQLKVSKKLEKDRDSMQEFLYETPSKVERPIVFAEPEKPQQIIRTDVPPPLRLSDGRPIRTQAFETPASRPPPIPDILRQTMSSASSGLTSSLSEAQFFIPPNVVPPPATPHESRDSKERMKSSTSRKPAEVLDSVKNLRGPTSTRGGSQRRPAADENEEDSLSGSDSLSSYSDSEDEGNVNRRPIARPSSRGDAQPRRDAPAHGHRKGGRKA